MPVLRREKDLEIALPDDAFFRFEERATLHMINTQGPLRSAVRAFANLLGLDVEVYLLDHHQAMKRLPITEVPS